METMYFDYKNMRKGIYLTLWKMTWFICFKGTSQHLKSLQKGHIYIVTYFLSKNNGLKWLGVFFFLSHEVLSYGIISKAESYKFEAHWCICTFYIKKILNSTFCQILYNLKCLWCVHGFLWKSGLCFTKKHEQINKCLLIIN